jgi:hypothetical protein
MNSTRLLIDSLRNVLSGAPSAVCEDEFLVLNVRIRSLVDAQPVLQGLVDDVKNGIIEYEGAGVQVAPEEEDRNKSSHFVRNDETDVILSGELLDNEWLCPQHTEIYEEAFREQEEQFDFDEWQRYSILQDVQECPNCQLNSWVEITLNKNYLEDQFRKRIGSDLPLLAGDLRNIRIFYWADLNHFYSKINENLHRTQLSIAKWDLPCLFICLSNAENDGSDYFKSISADDCTKTETIEPILKQLLNAPTLKSISHSRQSYIQEYPDNVGYLPPEYWLNPQALAKSFTEEPLPNWFIGIAPLFVYSLLATVSSKVFQNEDNFRFEIKREFDLALECSISGDAIYVDQEGQNIRVNLTHEVLRQLLNFFSVALQAKYTSINHDLVQRSIVYGTNFSFGAFFSQIDRVNRFYEFEYKHLLGDRFEQQSRTLSAFISDMVSLRQQLSSLMDSLSKDLSGLTIAVLATTALAIVAKIIDISTWDNLLIYGIVTSFIFAYLYITVFLLRIDNLKSLGERAVDEFMRDMKLSQQIWDFPLHKIGVREKDLDRASILKPLLSQHNTNQLIAEATGILAQILFVVLAISKNLGWLAAPKLILDSIFLVWSYRNRADNTSRFIYYSLIWVTTLVFTVIVYF